MRRTTQAERDADEALDLIDAGPKLPVPILIGIVVVGLLIWLAKAIATGN